MIIIDSQEEYDKLYKEFQENDSIIVPIYTNEFMHTKLKTLSLVWINTIQSNSDYIMVVDHSEILYKSDQAIISNIFNKRLKFIIDKKELLYSLPTIQNSIDLELLHYLDTGNKLSWPEFKTQIQFKNVYPRYSKLNLLIPIAKWIEYFSKIKPIIRNLVESYNPLDRAYNFYNDLVIPGLANIESNGLRVDLGKINKSVIKHINVDTHNNLMYSQYNIFTTTGRPSNRFNTINFAALNKESGIREMFISRFDKGAMVEFDFESYHLRIIGSLVDYKFPKESVHEYLGKQYFNVNELTDEQYEESKQISFRQLYGGVQREYEHIEFFGKTKHYISNLWNNWKSKGFIESPVSGRKLYKKNFPPLNAQKLFNYLIQLLETELNMDKISKVNSYLKSYNTKLVLYTYDSFLFDFDFSDGKKCINGIRRTLEDGGYVVRQYVGNNYSEMKEISKK